MPKVDSLRLRHMLDAAQEAIAFARGRSRGDLDTDRMFALALVKCVEIIGEAASGVSNEIQQQHTSLPWTDIIGMRHRLTHGYFSVDMDRVWDTVTVDLPALARELEGVLSSLEKKPKA